MTIRTRLLFFGAMALVFLGLSASPSLGCHQPPPLTITYSWAPQALVGITTNGVPSGPVSTAIGNWNAALSFNCSPVLFLGYCWRPDC